MQRFSSGPLPRTFQLLVVAAAAVAISLLAFQSALSAPSTSTKILSNRIVIAPSNARVDLLVIQGLGTLRAQCPPGSESAFMYYQNTTDGPVDYWNNYGAGAAADAMKAKIVPSLSNENVAGFRDGVQFGGQMELGKGNNPGPRKTATILVGIYRSGPNAWCGFQATATTWKTN